MRIQLGAPIPLSQLGYAASEEAVTGIATDSREIELGDLFLALRGEKTDGTNYVKEAIWRGAIAVMSESAVSGCPCLTVRSVTDAIADLAREYADTVRHKTVAVTGSVGKSTVLSYLKTVLSTTFRVHAPGGNYNTDLGLPLTMLEMPPDTEILLLEMGARHSGDIHRLSLLAKPEIAAITNIGSSHLETFGTKDAILRAKTEITDGMPSYGRLVLNIDDPLLFKYASVSTQRVITLSADKANADYTLPSDFQGKGTAVRYAALFALAIGDLLGIERSKVKGALPLCLAPPMRQEKIEHGGITYLMDAYNASPESTLAAFELLSLYVSLGREAYAILGDMRELGEESQALHRMVGEAYARLGARKLFCYGEKARAIGEGAETGGMSPSAIEYYTLGEEPLLLRSVRRQLKSQDVILLKASRAMRLDRLLCQLLG